MKRLIVLILIVINAFIFTACGSFNLKVANPTTKTLIEGQWKIERVKVPNLPEGAKDSIEGTIVSFSNEEVLLIGKVYENISYKVKVVNKDAYLYDVMGYIPDNINPADEDIKVLTISSNNTFIKDIMFIEDGVYLIEDSILYQLVRVDKEPLQSVHNSINHIDDDSYYKIDSGVLIGLRSQEDEEGNEYRTLWVSNVNGELKVEEIPYLLLPRKNGFFKVTNKREYNEENYFKDIIVFEDMNGKKIEFHNDLLTATNENVNIDRGITFIGNDFMSTRTYKYNDESQEEILSTYVLDLNTLGFNKPIPLGTLTDTTDMSNVILSSDKNSILKNNDINSFTNFAIRRKQGRWSFYTLSQEKAYKSRTNKKEYDGNEEKGKNFEAKHEKIDITLRVSEKIARHDEIFIPWQGIQKQVPSAVDAISSPNRNLAVIRTKSKLYIYKIVNNNLDKASEIVVPLEGKENIVMAEWAEGDYVGYWSDQVNLLKSK